jgi:2-C-methyl-D-erythritol 2,4-cyclodiphosphate synthase
MNYRVGIGYDIHRLVEGRKLFLGGLEIPHNKGLLGHSDADVLLHAICDALLGASGDGDIGEHFPDTEPKYRDISSTELLKTVDTLLKKKGFCVNNIDAVVVAQEPNLTAFKKRIRDNIAGLLKISKDSVNIKAKTNEGLGETGNKEAISAYAQASLIREV